MDVLKWASYGLRLVRAGESVGDLLKKMKH